MSKAAIKQYFDPEPTELSLEDRVYLEDFYDCDNEPTNVRLQKLALSLTFENGTPAETEALYIRATANLKKIAPNVQSITFNGGYLLNPIDETPEAFRKELVELKSHFDILGRLFKENGLPVKHVQFSVMETFEDYTLNDANYSELINELFAYELQSEEREHYKATFTYVADGTPFLVKCFFNNTNLRDREPKTRRRFYNAMSSVA
ncbi:hypothetical protein M3Y98_00843500 [Aphelenchoides besseyi]|nr:hypothetical protein M3Y98_00843500 [Aphelenchoides besseyi]KAI6202478.1 hypothetical protein M3Y96_00953300 [Aphelenchoides besseyi]